MWDSGRIPPGGTDHANWIKTLGEWSEGVLIINGLRTVSMHYPMICGRKRYCLMTRIAGIVEVLSHGAQVSEYP
jgi:hypothetical protein